MGACKMNKMASVGHGFPQSRGKPSSMDSTADSFRPTGLQASTVVQMLIFKTIRSLSKFCTVLSFATVYLGTIPANGNITVQSTSYNWSSDLTFLNGAHVISESSGVWRLAVLPDPVTIFSSGLAYYKDPVRMKDTNSGLSASFNTSFAVDKVDYTSYHQHADGFAFVISADNTISGGYGERLGIFDQYSGETHFKSIVVEFDGFLNPDVNDISDNHVSFDFVSNNWTAAANASDVNVQVWDNKTLFAWVEYSNYTQKLEARVSNENSRPITPLLNYTVDLFNNVEENMWVGFSAGTGNPGLAAYFVRDWSFESYGMPPSSPVGPTPTKLATNRAVGISVGVAALLLACIFIVAYRMYGGKLGYKHCRLGWPIFVEEEEMVELEGIPERLSYKQLSAATKNFSQESKLGQGGFGSVHQGVLPSGIPIAVKKINGDSTQGEREFMAEVSIISRLRHRNLIQLKGWCKDAVKGYYLLVYKLMPNGSLDKVLFARASEGTACLSWPQRYNIVTGTAAALEYLHQGWTQQLIHRDVKSSNIMLDQRWNAKLGDFGLARLVDHERTRDSVTLVAGTLGYIAPEVTISGKFTDKSDVYAFGAVMLEVICGRKAFSPHLPDDEIFLVDWVWHRLSEGSLLSTVDERLQLYEDDWMEVMLKIGLLCSHPNPLARPTMRQVLQILTGEAPMPSIPSSKPVVFYSSDSLSESNRQDIGSSSRFQSESTSLVSTKFSDSTGPPTSKFLGTSLNTEFLGTSLNTDSSN